MLKHRAVTAPHNVYRPDPRVRSLPYLAGETLGGYCTGCGATVPVRYLLYTPAVIGAHGIAASFQWKRVLFAFEKQYCADDGTPPPNEWFFEIASALKTATPKD